MDAKEFSLIEYYHLKIEKNIFNENDVFSFLILIRQYAERATPTREIGDFIAHREKDRGYIKNYLYETKKKLEKVGKTNVTIDIKPVFTFKEISKSINDVLLLLKLSTFSDDNIARIIICVISILQEVEIVDKAKDIIGKLKFRIVPVVIGMSQLVQNTTQIWLVGRVCINSVKQIFAEFLVLSVLVPVEKNY